MRDAPRRDGGTSAGIGDHFALCFSAAGRSGGSFAAVVKDPPTGSVRRWGCAGRKAAPLPEASTLPPRSMNSFTAAIRRGVITFL